MSVSQQAATLAVATRDRLTHWGRRGRREVELRRVESRLTREYARLGSDISARVESGQLRLPEGSGFDQSLRAIQALQAELRRLRAAAAQGMAKASTERLAPPPVASLSPRAADTRAHEHPPLAPRASCEELRAALHSARARLRPSGIHAEPFAGTAIPGHHDELGASAALRQGIAALEQALREAGCHD